MKRWTAAALKKSPWFQELLTRIQEAQMRRANATPDRRPALNAEAQQFSRQISGWSQSLANPDLARSVRRQIEADVAAVNERLAQISTDLDQLNASSASNDIEVSAEDVAERLNQLADSLANEDATRANLELSLHIDRIVGFNDGRVIVRTCRLGALASAVENLADASSASSAQVLATDGTRQSKPRRRARLRVASVDEKGNNLDDAAHFAADINRFAGLGPEWFTEDLFRIPERTFWAKENAALVAARRKQGKTHAQLAEEFDVSTPTIRHAIKIAAETDEELKTMPRKLTRTRWPEKHYLEVATMWKQGMRQNKELREFFVKSQPLISRALELAGLGRAQRSNKNRDAEPPI